MLLGSLPILLTRNNVQWVYGFYGVHSFDYPRWVSPEKIHHFSISLRLVSQYRINVNFAVITLCCTFTIVISTSVVVYRILTSVRTRTA